MSVRVSSRTVMEPAAGGAGGGDATGVGLTRGRFFDPLIIFAVLMVVGGLTLALTGTGASARG